MHHRPSAPRAALVALALAALAASFAAAQEQAKSKKSKAPKVRPAATGLVAGENKATPVDRIRVKPGFKVELLYSVPGETQGSWVNLGLDGKGRFIAADQYGGLFRFAPPPPGQPLDPATIEKVPADVRTVMGMLWFNDALYVMASDFSKKRPTGVYRLTDSDADDKLDKVELVREIDAGGGHGAHAILPAPDGRNLLLICGNDTKPPKDAGSLVPPHWGEDHLLPRMPDGRGFMRDVLAPGGMIFRMSPDGRNIDIVASGFRNIYDAAIDREGELFTYDADMEYDMNTSWYRPTRINHVTSGGEFGWRNGAGKWPEFYPDSLPAILNVGPGSPTGLAFGYGAKFPSKYQHALYIQDWSWGKLYAVHLTPDGSTYRAEKEEFLSGTPLPMTDLIVHPADGAMYFVIGGRKVQSGLYRITYVGDEDTAPAAHVTRPNPLRELRRKLEQYHRADPAALEIAWPHLNHPDRFIRTAARIAIEHQPVEQWLSRALRETDTDRLLEATLALVRAGGIDPQHRKPHDPPVDTALGDKILAVLLSQDYARLTEAQRITLLRTYEIFFVRFGRPSDGAAHRIVTELEPGFPSGSREINWLLCEVLVYLQSPVVAARAVPLLHSAPTQEEQIEYARSLRMLKVGWTPELRRSYMQWFLRAANYRGGASFDKFIEFIRNDAIASLSDADKAALADILDQKPQRKSPLENMAEFYAGRTPRQWTLEELSAAASTGMKGRSFENGRRMFGAALCFTCHRFGNEGGMTGPDLTAAGGRYSPHDLLDQIINPSKEINEQFVPIVLTKNDGETVTGMIVNLTGDSVRVNTDPSDPNQQVAVDRKEVRSIEPSKVSPMPPGLLNLLTRDEILDLLAYVLSGGNADSAAFKP